MTKRPYGPEGKITINRENHHLGRAFVGHEVGLEPRGDDVLGVWFHNIELGEIRASPTNTAIDLACVRFMNKKTKKRKAA